MTSVSSATRFSTSLKSSTPSRNSSGSSPATTRTSRRGAPVAPRRRAGRRRGAGRRAAAVAGAGGNGRGRRAIAAAATIRRRATATSPQAKIEDLLKEGQEVLVQVVKEPLGTKGARLTSHVTMPGRFLVFMPTVDHVGVSRKIESREERARLRGIVREFREEHGFTGGVIIRTAAGGPLRRTTSSAT